MQNSRGSLLATVTVSYISILFLLMWHDFMQAAQALCGYLDFKKNLKSIVTLHEAMLLADLKWSPEVRFTDVDPCSFCQ